MNEILQEFNEWLAQRNSKGTADMYTKYIARIDEPLTLDMDYTVISSALNRHVRNDPVKYAFVKYFKFLKQRGEIDPKKEQKANMIIVKLKDMELKSQKSSISSVGDLQQRLLSMRQVQEIVDNAYNIENVYTSAWKEKIDINEFKRIKQSLALRLLFETATRANELLQLKYKYIDEDKREIEIPRSISKGTYDRVVEYSENTQKYLQQYKNELSKVNKDNKVFDYSYQTFLRLFKRCAKSLSVSPTPHWFRHSSLTNLALKMRSEGIQYAVIKEKLRKYAGHVNSDVTEIYIRLLKNQRTERLIDKYDGGLK